MASTTKAPAKAKTKKVAAPAAETVESATTNTLLDIPDGPKDIADIDVAVEKVMEAQETAKEEKVKEKEKMAEVEESINNLQAAMKEVHESSEELNKKISQDANVAEVEVKKELEHIEEVKKKYVPKNNVTYTWNGIML